MLRRGLRRTRQCRVLYFEVHGDFNAADRAANVPVSASVTPLVRSFEENFFGEDIGPDFDLLSRSIWSEVSHEVRLRKVQTGPELGTASLAQRIVGKEVSSDSECSRCPGDDHRCKGFHEGSQERNRRRELRRAYLCSLQDGLRPVCDVT